jgi:hypothetical protein
MFPIFWSKSEILSRKTFVLRKESTMHVPFSFHGLFSGNQLMLERFWSKSHYWWFLHKGQEVTSLPILEEGIYMISNRPNLRTQSYTAACP